MLGWVLTILLGLGVAQAAVTERWPYKKEKRPKFFFCKKIKITIFYISFSYAKILRETKFQPREFSRSGSKAMSVDRREKERVKVNDYNDYNGQYLSPEPKTF